MPDNRPVIALEPLSEAEVKRITGVQEAKRVRTDFPKRATAAKPPAALREWQKSIEPPRAPKNPEVKFKAPSLTRSALTRMRTATDAGLSPDVLAKQSLKTDELFGIVFSGLATYGFMQLEAEYRRRKAAGGAAAARADAEWEKHVQTFSRAFAAAGLPNVGEAELRQFVKELNANTANRDAIIAIWNSGVDPATVSLNASQLPVASFVAISDVVRDATAILTPIKTICSQPISEGSFTQHFSHSVSLSVRIAYPCGISWSGIEWCHKTVTLAGVSFSLAVSVGYRVTCCGATVWGQVGAQVCATIVGISVCAQCTATITGVAGFSRTPVSGGCQYGLGINATLKCTLAGATILNLSYPFGWTITGPCPPAGFC